jgi:hypothetical protein
MARAALALAVVLAIAGDARAQAPGQVTPQVAPPAPPAAPSTVMQRRWAVAASIGSETLQAKTDGAPKVPFGVLEVALRLRVAPVFELGLSFTGGGATEGDLTTGGLYLEGRYRFLAENRWNLFALASLGVASVAPKDGSSDTEKQGRGSMRLGGGIERRFGAFALDATLRLVGIGKNPEVPMAVPATNDNAMTRLGVSGGTISLGALYYF